MTEELQVRARGGRLALLVGIDRYPLLEERFQLRSCVHDARLMAGVLEERFGFAAEDVRLLLDKAATRDGILAGLADLRRRARPGHQLVFYYSGHGSRIRDREGDEPDGWDETIVPHDGGRKPRDGGRAPHPCRDVTDDEIYAWILETSAITPYVTVIADTCYSGTIVRKGRPRRQRGKYVPRDHRAVSDLPPSPVAPALRLRRPRKPGAAFLPASDRYVLLAACRAGESAGVRTAAAGETPASIFTFHLCEALRRAREGATYRDLLPPVRAAVAAETSDQTPQLEGARERVLFAGTGAAKGASSAPAPAARLARLWDLLRASAADPANPLSGCLEAALLRRGPDGVFAPAYAGAGGGPTYHDGERLALRVRHRFGAPLHLHVLDLGLSGAVALLFPVPGATEPLAPGCELLIGVRPGDEVVVRLPSAPGAPHEGWEQVVVVATSHETDLAWIAAAGGRPAEPPLLAGQHWTAVTLDFLVRRRG